MKKYLIVLTGLALILNACSDGGKENSVKLDSGIEANGGKRYGGKLTISQSENIKSIFPPGIVDVYSGTIAEHVYERLVRFNPKTLELEGGVAESWTVDSSGTVYTFNIKKGILFHENPIFEGGSRELTADDIKFSIELMCTKHENNLMFSSTFKDRLLGANDFFENGKQSEEGGLKGLKVIDPYTLELTLERPFSPFVYTLAHPSLSIIPKKAYEQQGTNITIGSGPFKIAEGQKINDNTKIILLKNTEYHKQDTLGNQLPFLDTLEILVIDSKKTELDEFEAGRLDIVNGLPAESIRKIVEQQIANFQQKPPKFILDRSPNMGTEYYEFNTMHKALKDKRVRQAINYAINRNKIVDEVLKGEAYGPAEHGICPPSFKGYDISKIPGYNYDVEKAQQLLAEAGYPDGDNFPSIKLELNSGGFKHTTVAFEIQKQLMDNLNINVDLEVVPFAQKLEDEQYGRADIFRTAWLADYPNPQNFLFIFYGKNVPESSEEPSYPNITRFVNKEYDELYEKALETQDQEKSYEYLLEAEKILIEEAPIAVLWYNEHYRLVQSNVRSYYSNSMNYKDYSIVYLKTMTADEEIIR